MAIDQYLNLDIENESEQAIQLQYLHEKHQPEKISNNIFNALINTEENLSEVVLKLLDLLLEKNSLKIMNCLILNFLSMETGDSNSAKDQLPLSARSVIEVEKPDVKVVLIDT